MKADLHCHSYYSDGTLSPKDVVDLAHTNGVELLALTDHDSVQGLNEARKQSELHGIRSVSYTHLTLPTNREE